MRRWALTPSSFKQSAPSSSRPAVLSEGYLERPLSSAATGAQKVRISETHQIDLAIESGAVTAPAISFDGQPPFAPSPRRNERSSSMCPDAGSSPSWK